MIPNCRWRQPHQRPISIIKPFALLAILNLLPIELRHSNRYIPSQPNRVGPTSIIQPEIQPQQEPIPQINGIELKVGRQDRIGQAQRHTTVVSPHTDFASMIEDILLDFLADFVEAGQDEVVAVLREWDELGGGAQGVGDAQAHHGGDPSGFFWGFELEVAVDVGDLLVVLEQVVQLLGVLDQVVVVGGDYVVCVVFVACAAPAAAAQGFLQADQGFRLLRLRLHQSYNYVNGVVRLLQGNFLKLANPDKRIFVDHSHEGFVFLSFRLINKVQS